MGAACKRWLFAAARHYSGPILRSSRGAIRPELAAPQALAMRSRARALIAAAGATVLAAGAAATVHPPRHAPAHHPHSLDYRHAEMPGCPIAQASPHFALCDEGCTNVDTSTVTLDYPATTTDGRRTIEYLQAALAKAWAGHEGTVDLWVRTGCNGAREARYLFESVELFWPHGVGKIIVVLDAADAAIVNHIVPPDSAHAYDVRFEHVPCMPARAFNQVSYLMADHYSTAEVIVTIDSDCVLHSPVTPSLIFRDGRIRLPHSTAFQAGAWNALVERFTGAGTFAHHTMVSQPVAFHRSTFAAYRAWYKRTRGRCHLDDVARMLSERPPVDLLWFCWMCQLGTFVNATGLTAGEYDMVDVDAPTDRPYQRLAIHVNYEMAPGADYDASSRLIANQGLCRVAGDRVSGCAGAPLDYLHDHLFKYHTYEWGADASSKEREAAAYVSEVRRFLDEAGG